MYFVVILSCMFLICISVRSKDHHKPMEAFQNLYKTYTVTVEH